MRHILYHIKPYKRQISLIFILTLCQIFSSLYTPTILSTLVTDGILKNNTTVIYTQGLLMLLASSIDLILSIIIGLLIAKFAIGFSKDLRLSLFNKIQHFSTHDFQQFGTSSYIKRSTTDTQTLSSTIGFSMRLALMAPVMFFGAIILSMRINFQLSLIILVTTPIMLIILFYLVKSISVGFTSLRHIADKMTEIIHEGLTGIRVIRAFNKEPFELERFNIENLRFKNVSFDLNIKFSYMMPIMMIMINCSNAAVVWIGAGLIEKNQLQIGQLIAILEYSSLVLVALMLLSMVAIMIPQGIVSASRINDVLAQENTQIFVEFGQPLNAITSVSFKNVYFKYSGAEKSMLNDITFSAQTGDKIAIIGSTGSGKSTLINLLLRFVDTTNGQLLYNNININEFSENTLRAQIGYVPQNRNLFAGTIRDNLRFGKVDASDSEMIDALKMAQAWDFVSKLDGQLDARVEQHGDNFSGGQKQRLSIARALIKQASLLIFDDSFSALDAKTESNLRKALQPLTERAIVFIVAQRISSVVDATKIIVLNEGHIVGIGTHDELSQHNTIYKEIIQSQSNINELDT